MSTRVRAPRVTAVTLLSISLVLAGWAAAGRTGAGGPTGRAAAAPSQKGAATASIYTVKPGDSLYSISRKFNMTVAHLKSANGLKSTLLKVGQRLVVGKAAAGVAGGYDLRLLHRLERGETLEAVAMRYGTPMQAIIEANGGKAPAAGTIAVIPYPSLPVRPISRQPRLPSHLVAGYYVKSSASDSLAFSSVKEYGQALDLLIFASHRIRPDGSVDGTLYDDQREAARQGGGRFLIMFTNLNGGRFDRNLVHLILRSPELRKKAVDGILEVVEREKAAGADIDFENVPPEDRRYFSQFMRELADALHPVGYMVTASVPAKLKENPSQGWSGAFDYPLLASICDLVFVMAYDQHYATGAAGPVAGIDWVRAVCEYATTAVPADKLVLGVPSYGYDWRIGRRGARAVPAFRALEMASAHGVQVSRDATGLVPFFYYKDGRIKRVVYFEDAASLAHKMELVRNLGLRGIVFWRLGYEDPRVWEVVSPEAS